LTISYDLTRYFDETDLTEVKATLSQTTRVYERTRVSGEQRTISKRTIERIRAVVSPTPVKEIEHEIWNEDQPTASNRVCVESTRNSIPARFCVSVDEDLNEWKIATSTVVFDEERILLDLVYSSSSVTQPLLKVSYEYR